MAITKKPAKPAQDTSPTAADAFISGAPDAGGVPPASKPRRVGNPP